MAQSLAKVTLHIVFSTKYRYPFLHDSTIRHKTHAYMGGICNRLGCPAIAVGGVDDHAHILCSLSRTLTIADLLEEVKKCSSAWVKDTNPDLQQFRWQGGYAVFSVSERAVDIVRRYIQNQEAHHGKKNFQRELRTLLAEHKVEYDERFIWD